MKTIALKDGADFDGWRSAARTLLRAGVPPEQVTWVVSGEATLFVGDESAHQGDGLLSPSGRGQGEGLRAQNQLTTQDEGPPSPGASRRPLPVGERQARVPAELLGLIESLICHSDPQRYGLAYRLLWRVTHGERNLLQLITDPDVLRARNAEKSVRRDSHKMKAFVRFREVRADDRAELIAPVQSTVGSAADNTVFIAWFEPTHYIVERIAPFFVRRFTGMRWSILTPYRSAHWDGNALSFGPGASKYNAPSEDLFETYWRTYFANIFNPARLKVQAMKSEMPMKYWKNLPEAQLIPELIQQARPRMAAMIEAAPTEPNQKIPAPPKRLPRP